MTLPGELQFLERTFRGAADLPAMMSLARECAATHVHVVDLPYRFSSWALDDPDNARLWFDGDGRLAAWAVMQAPFWTIDCVCSPALDSGLLPTVLTWADGRARDLLSSGGGRPAWFVNVFADQLQRIRIVEAAGFVNQAAVPVDPWSKVWLRRPANSPLPPAAIPDGYQVRLLAGMAEVPAYVVLHQTVFESKNMTLAWRERTLQQQAYRPELDVVVTAAAADTPVAFCVGWLDRATETGQIEPLGCHPDHQRLGLGRIALRDCVRRLKEQGARQIVVETDHYRTGAIDLYGELGFQLSQHIWIFRKDYTT